MNKIVIICPYFGSLPKYFPTWLLSCKYNKTIDFILFTDQNIDYDIPNLKVINMQFSQVQKLVKNKLGEDIELYYPYKLCDYKPMYGVLFSDYLRDYDYWGHCDLDLVFGDLQKYFNKYDIYKFKKFLDLGHLSLYKNTHDNNLSFKLGGSKCGNWKRVVKDKKGHAFDERNGILEIYKYNRIPFFDKRIYADISIIYKRFRCALDDINYDYQVFYWEKGHIYRDYWVNNEKHKEEFMYIHFKQRKNMMPFFDIGNVNSFYIGPEGFFEKCDESTKKEVELINPFYGEKFEKEEFAKFEKEEKYSNYVHKVKKFLRGLING